MREIIFRGKRIDNGEWVEGFFVSQANDTYIFEPSQVNHGIDIGGYLDCCQMQEVIPETVEQYTGLTDKNGKKIFEGDIVRGRHWTSYNDKSIEEWHLWRVDWSEKSGLITFIDSPTTKFELSIHDFADFEEIEVIGNIHDNPELLKGGEGK